MDDKRKPMVGWYDPKQLWTTAGKTIVSTIIGENADGRLTNASLTSQPVYDYSTQLEITDRDFKVTKSPRKDLWIDYVADLGDGWDSTALLAHHIASGTMPDEYGSERRGEILVFGGDQVYPTASQQEYEERLVAPYKLAAQTAAIPGNNQSVGEIADLKQSPHVFAIPGNHDWYDSLNAFRYLFCSRYFNERLFAGGWRTRQRRSYFAIKLPHNWWLFGIDLQLTHNLDWAQLEYFRTIIEPQPSDGKQVEGPKFNPHSKVIICAPEPLWVAERKYKDVANSTDYDEENLNLRFLERLIRDSGSKVRLYIAGDWHHYMRFASEDDRYQMITAGGGGAFLHPTHDIKFDSLESLEGRKMKRRSRYPSGKVSRSLTYWNLLFLWFNLKFGIVTGALYAIVAWLFHGRIDLPDTYTWWTFFQTALGKTLNDLVDKPWVVIIMVVLIGGLIFFTDTNSKWQKYAGGGLHALTHLAAVFLIAWTGFLIYDEYGQFWPVIKWFGPEWGWALVTLPFTFALGWLVGAIIMGLYLLISLQVFGRHANEAFSAIKVKDYKNFLRLHITKDGIEIFPIKIEKVGKWDDSKIPSVGSSPPEFIEGSSIMVRN